MQRPRAAAFGRPVRVRRMNQRRISSNDLPREIQAVSLSRARIAGGRAADESEQHARSDNMRPNVTLTGTLLLLFSLVSIACGSSLPTPAPTDSLRGVNNLAPAAGTTLQAGQTVTFSGTVGYSLASTESGTLVMVIQDQASRLLQEPGTQPSVAVGKGSGDVTLSQTLTLPATGITSIVVMFGLVPMGTDRTSIVTTMSYPVR